MFDATGGTRESPSDIQLAKVDRSRTAHRTGAAQTKGMPVQRENCLYL
jgi:hypothetical protein